MSFKLKTGAFNLRKAYFGLGQEPFSRKLLEGQRIKRLQEGWFYSEGHWSPEAGPRGVTWSHN